VAAPPPRMCCLYGPDSSTVVTTKCRIVRKGSVCAKSAKHHGETYPFIGEVTVKNCQLC
jgi:hypothetical protein